MYKYFFFIALFFSTNVLAVTFDQKTFNQLPDTVQAEIVKSVADKAAEVKEQNSPISTSNLDKYADIGAKVARGLAAGAKELGVAVNNFSQTDVGKVAMWLITFASFCSAIISPLHRG